MPRDIDTRLNALEARRKGTDQLTRVAMDAQNEILAKSFISEGHQCREQGKTYTRYALGAMQEVDADYTRISLETAERVGRQLDRALEKAGNPVKFGLQGSVPLNIHIRGVSDVDLLTLDADFFIYAQSGRVSQLGLYITPTTKTLVGVLRLVRRHAERTLQEKYPAADIDTSGSKAIKISGGSLPRPVDVVPAHWHDTIQYQQNYAEQDRAVTILDKKKMQTLDNLPFLHIALVNARDEATMGNLKKAIRLCENVRSDAEYDIALPNLDIAATMYHADQVALIAGGIYELNILVETRRHLDYLYKNPTYVKALRVPDGSRYIFDTEEKLGALTSLSVELDDLLRQVAKEQSSLLARREHLSLSESRSAVESLYIP